MNYINVEENIESKKGRWGLSLNNKNKMTKTLLEI